MSINTNRQNMRVRLMFLNEVLQGIESARDSIWSKECKSFLEATQEILDKPNLIAFRYQGEKYPVITGRRTNVLRNSANLPQELEEEFDAKYKFYVTDWQNNLAKFKNYLSDLTKICRNKGEMLNALPVSLYDIFDEPYFQPLENAIGLHVDDAKDMYQDNIGMLNKITKYVSLKALL